MRHTFYAVFEDEEGARAAAVELERRDFSVLIHRGAIDAEALHGGESARRTGAVTGSVATGALGAVAGGLALASVGLGAAGAAAGALAGTIFGGVMGGIAGSSSPEHHLALLEREIAAGHVVLAVESPGLTAEEDAEALVRRAGGRVEHRRAV